MSETKSITLEEILKDGLDSLKMTVIPQLNIAHLLGEMKRCVKRITKRIFDAIRVLKEINDRLAYSAANNKNEVYMNGERYIKISSKHISRSIGISERRVSVVRDLLVKLGVIKFLPTFKRDSKWQNIWRVSVHAESLHVDNRILEVAKNKNDFKVRDMNTLELAKWSNARTFSRYSQSEIPNIEISELDAKNKHLTSNPRLVFLRGEKKKDIIKDIREYNRERRILVQNADWTNIYQEYIMDNPILTANAKVDMSIMKGYKDPLAKYRNDDYFDDIEGDYLDVWIKNHHRPKVEREIEARNRGLLMKQLRFV